MIEFRPCVRDLGCGQAWEAVWKVKPRAPIACVECRHPMYAKTSRAGMRFFAHAPHAPDCEIAREGESEAHHLLKLELAWAARDAGAHAELEVRTPDGSWRADVLASAPDGSWCRRCGRTASRSTPRRSPCAFGIPHRHLRTSRPQPPTHRYNFAVPGAPAVRRPYQRLYGHHTAPPLRPRRSSHPYHAPPRCRSDRLPLPRPAPPRPRTRISRCQATGRPRTSGPVDAHPAGRRHPCRPGHPRRDRLHLAVDSAGQ